MCSDPALKMQLLKTYFFIKITFTSSEFLYFVLILPALFPHFIALQYQDIFLSGLFLFLFLLLLHAAGSFPPPPLLHQLSLRRGAAEGTNRELTSISADMCAISLRAL